MSIYHPQKGMTLVEVLTVLGILGFLSLTISAFQSDVFRQQVVAREGLEADAELRSAVRAFMRDLRSAAPSQTGAYALGSTGTSTLIFYSDVNGDGLRERVRYFLSGNTLRRGVILPTGEPATYQEEGEVVSDVVHHLVLGPTIFSYYDASFTGTTSPLSQPVTVSVVRHVRMTLTVDRDVSRPPASITASGGVSIRSLKDNY